MILAFCTFCIIVLCISQDANREGLPTLTWVACLTILTVGSCYAAELIKYWI